MYMNVPISAIRNYMGVLGNFYILLWAQGSQGMRLAQRYMHVYTHKNLYAGFNTTC